MSLMNRSLLILVLLLTACQSVPVDPKVTYENEVIRLRSIEAGTIMRAQFWRTDALDECRSKQYEVQCMAAVRKAYAIKVEDAYAATKKGEEAAASAFAHARAVKQ